ncbi:MAG: hypothetical protein NVSMB26_15640 [Beijerinckiaceae bacterium]
MTSGSNFGQWKTIATAPKDGSLVLVAIRESEQGPAQVDVARWARPEPSQEKCWVSAESTPGCAIVYAEGELAFWMPLPSSVPRLRSGSIASSKLPELPKAKGEIGGSGI